MSKERITLCEDEFTEREKRIIKDFVRGRGYNARRNKVRRAILICLIMFLVPIVILLWGIRTNPARFVEQDRELISTQVEERSVTGIWKYSRMLSTSGISSMAVLVIVIWLLVERERLSSIIVKYHEKYKKTETDTF